MVKKGGKIKIGGSKLPKIGKMRGGNLSGVGKPKIRNINTMNAKSSCPSGSWCFEHNTLLYVIIGLLLVIVSYFFTKTEICKNITNAIFSRRTDSTTTNYISNNYQQHGNSASIYPPQGNHTANYTNPFAPPLKPNHYFMTGKTLDVRDMNVNLDTIHSTSQQGNPPGITLKSYETMPNLNVHGGNVNGVPINVRTSHRNVNFAQVGILTRNDDGETILPLFGRPLATNRNKWQYYTMNDKFQTIKLPITNKNRSCSSEYGCDEVYEGDNIHVKGFNQTFKATIYETNTPEYIPL